MTTENIVYNLRKKAHEHILHKETYKVNIESLEDFIYRDGYKWREFLVVLQPKLLQKNLGTKTQSILNRTFLIREEDVFLNPHTSKCELVTGMVLNGTDTKVNLIGVLTDEVYKSEGLEIRRIGPTEELDEIWKEEIGGYSWSRKDKVEGRLLTREVGFYESRKSLLATYPEYSTYVKIIRNINGKILAGMMADRSPIIEKLSEFDSMYSYCDNFEGNWSELLIIPPLGDRSIDEDMDYILDRALYMNRRDLFNRNSFPHFSTMSHVLATSLDGEDRKVNLSSKLIGDSSKVEIYTYAHQEVYNQKFTRYIFRKDINTLGNTYFTTNIFPSVGEDYIVNNKFLATRNSYLEELG